MWSPKPDSSNGVSSWEKFLLALENDLVGEDVVVRVEEVMPMRHRRHFDTAAGEIAVDERIADLRAESDVVGGPEGV